MEPTNGGDVLHEISELIEKRLPAISDDDPALPHLTQFQSLLGPLRSSLSAAPRRRYR
jgi:hypothetical protein